MQKSIVLSFLPYIQYHEIGKNSTKVLDFSILLRCSDLRQTKDICKFWIHFCKSVQTFHAKVVCPTFWDRPPSLFDFSAFSPRAFSLTTAMQLLRADRLGQPSVRYAVFVFFFSAAISAFFSVIILASASSHSSLVFAYTLNFFLFPSGNLG